MVHDYLSYADYSNGRSLVSYKRRQVMLETHISYLNHISNVVVNNDQELEAYMKVVTDLGYEGIMMKDPYWLWRDTNSRTTDFMKYKKRPTADLLCIRTEPGQGKYTDMIGALVLVDSVGREVSVGAGLSDSDRRGDYIGKVIEIEYEQILSTYIQPVFIAIREKKEID